MSQQEIRVNDPVVLPQKEALKGYWDALAAAKGSARGALAHLATQATERDEISPTLGTIYEIAQQHHAPQVSGGDVAES